MFDRLKFALHGRSSRWYSVRAKYLKTCPMCSACATKENLEVHHIIPFSVDPTKELDSRNLMTLCKYCHLVLGHLKDFDINNKDVRQLVNRFSYLRGLWKDLK